MSLEFAVKLNAYALPASTAFADICRLVQEADELGYEGVYLIDHLYMPEAQLAGFSDCLEPGRPFFPDPWTLFPALAMKTKRVKLGPQVTPLMRLHPVSIARAGAAIDWMSGGRFRLQIGAGWNAEEYEAFGLEYAEPALERSRRLVEGIHVIDRMWASDEPETFEGRHFSLRGAPSLWPKPVTRPRPPIWLGGSGRSVRAAVAEVADGWVPAPHHYTGMTPEIYRDGLAEIRARAVALGRPAAAITAAITVFVVIEPTRAQAEESARRLLRRDVWTDLSIQDLADRGIAFIGSPDDVAASLSRYVEAGAEHITIQLMPIRGTEDTVRRMRLVKETVVDSLQRVS